MEENHAGDMTSEPQPPPAANVMPPQSPVVLDNPGNPPAVGATPPAEANHLVKEEDDIYDPVPVDAAMMPPLEQYHRVPQGHRVMANGEMYLKTGPYVWELTGPDGKLLGLTNDQMPGPSFMAEHLGTYMLTLALGDGKKVTYTYDVVEDI